MEPRRTLRVTLSTAMKPLNSFVRPRVSRMISPLIEPPMLPQPPPSGQGAGSRIVQTKSGFTSKLSGFPDSPSAPRAAPPEGHHTLVAAEVVDHPRALAGASREEAVEAARRPLPAVGGAAD